MSINNGSVLVKELGKDCNTVKQQLKS